MWWWSGCLTWKHDPGPCPVDDTPHTACTPESVAAQQQIQVSLRPTCTVTVPVTFTTGTYRRAEHHPANVARAALAAEPRLPAPTPVPRPVPRPPQPRRPTPLGQRRAKPTRRTEPTCSLAEHELPPGLVLPPRADEDEE